MRWPPQYWGYSCAPLCLASKYFRNIPSLRNVTTILDSMNFGGNKHSNQSILHLHWDTPKRKEQGGVCRERKEEEEEQEKQEEAKRGGTVIHRWRRTQM